MSDQTKDLVRELVYLNKKNLIAIGYEKLVIDGTVKSLTIPDGARYAEIQLESSIATAAIRYKNCGNSTGTPTTTDGIFVVTGTIFDITGTENLRNFKATQVAAGTHTLHIQYWK